MALDSEASPGARLHCTWNHRKSRRPPPSELPPRAGNGCRTPAAFNPSSSLWLRTLGPLFQTRRLRIKERLTARKRGSQASSPACPPTDHRLPHASLKRGLGQGNRLLTSAYPGDHRKLGPWRRVPEDCFRDLCFLGLPREE